MSKRCYLQAFALVCVLSVLGCRDKKQTVVKLTNELNIERLSETVTITPSQLGWDFSGDKLKSVQVTDQATGDTVVSQLIDMDRDGVADQLVFQADFAAEESRSFVLKALKKPAVKVQSKAFARFVPERKDDFAWENDRIAFRMYGPALEDDGSGSGIDVWVKSTRELVINKWYKRADYHHDHGEGFDGYKVGSTRGCGGLGIWEDETMSVSRNFKTWQVLANGPICTAFKLDYAPWKCKSGEITESKTLMLAAGSNLNRMESVFFSSDYSDFECAFGIAKAKGGKVNMNAKEGWLRYWHLLAHENGMVGCAIVVNPACISKIVETKDHYLVIVKASVKEPLVYYAGACWSKSGDFNSVEQWDAYLKQFAKKLASPLKVEL